jgi:flagellum-specific ATP synthase
VLESKSRVRDLVIGVEHRESANALMRLEASYRKNEDLLLVGAYQKGSDPTVDAAVQLRRPILDFLQQRPDEPTPFAQSAGMLVHLAGAAAQLTRRPQ